ncbi:MAG: hypothetical protein D4R79_05315 [Comamonadaceae bacterium]|nr:MAG: hypothetical protein D4R79_05315 [Comamonadaceae bacterium]
MAKSNGATVGVDPGASWLGFMNVFNLPGDGGAYQFGSPWGTTDLRATFAGPVLSLSPNTIGDPNPYWYIGGGGPGAAGNKIMAASMYIESNGGVLGGQTVTFTGNVLANTLTLAHTSVAFIKDFASDYSSFNVISTPLVNGVFSINLATIADAGRHVQYGFETTGVNVWVTDVAPFGQVDITAVPEPASVSLLIGGIACLVGYRRNKANS